MSSDEPQAVPQAKRIFFRIPPVCPVCACHQTQTGSEKRATLCIFHFQVRLQRNSQYYPRKQNKIKQKTNIHGHQTTLKFLSMLCFDRYTYFTGEELQEKRKNPFSLVSHEFHSRPQEHSAPPHCIHLASYLHKLLQYKKKKANLTYLRSRFNFMHNYYSHG